MIDTCSSVSTIHYNDPTKDRIFKIRKRRTCSLICQDDGNWRESKSNIEQASVRRNNTRDANDEGLNKDTSNDSEDDDDMIIDMAKSEEGEATNCTGNDQEIVRNNHEAVDRNERKSNIIESVTSERDRVHIYLDDIVFYEDVNEEDETTQNNMGFIDTDGILNDLMRGSITPRAMSVRV